MTAQGAATPATVQASQMTAAKAAEVAAVDPATGKLSPEAEAKVDEIRNLSGPAEAASITQKLIDAATAETVEGVLSAGAYAPEVVGIAGQVSANPQAELQQRQAIIGTASGRKLKY